MIGCNSPALAEASLGTMKPLLWLSNIFINTFGITEPTPENARRMAIFIGLLLLGVIVAVTAIAFTLRSVFHP